MYGGVWCGVVWPRENYGIKQPLRVSTASANRKPH